MKKSGKMVFLTTVGALFLLSCGTQFGLRPFAGPVEPKATQETAQLEVGDNRSITFVKGRLEINLRPLTDEILNRQLASYAPKKEGFYQNPYESEVNPYTYGDWTPPEQQWATKRFTVFNLNVKNYEFPKVLVDPEKISLVSTNGRAYEALTYPAMVEYYLPYSWANAGNLYLNFEERKDILQKTLYKAKQFIFSGQEYSGYIVFPPLHDDVKKFEVRVEGVSLRFNFRNESVETVDIPYQFHREVYMAKEPRSMEQ